MRAPITRTSRVPMRRLLTATVAASMLIAACSGTDNDDVAPSTTVGATTTTVVERENDGVLVLGVYLPFTGEGSGLGQPMISAVEGAVDLINAGGGVLGNDIRIERADEGAGTGPGEMIAAGVDAIVGPASSLTALSHLGPAVDATSGVVTCSPTATALALDAFPDNGFFFRTAPSDSLQMAAIARQAQRTGAASVSIGYLDDPFGRGLRQAFVAEMEARRIEVFPAVGFSGDQEDLSGAAAELLAPNPGVIVVLGDADDGGRLLTALDSATDAAPPIIVNSAIRLARQTIQSLSPGFRSRLTGVSALARAVTSDASDGSFFTAHAVDCVNLIALATLDAGSDSPREIRTNMAAVSTGGRVCSAFATCAQLLMQGLEIDYNGASGSAELSSTTGDPVVARFESFGFDAEGAEIDSQWFDVP